MKHARKTVIALLLVSFLLSGFTGPMSSGAAESPRMDTQSPAAVQKEADGLFRAKFEGQDVAGSGETVDGVYRFAATQTDGEAWHVKLESNYPTVAGRDYRVTYRFRSDVEGKVKFGDFQEFEIHKGDNEITGIVIATGGMSYLDLQLGMLPPFSIDFTEVEIKEYADEVEYENALAVPVNFERESIVYEKHDQGYAPVLTRGRDEVSINYLATSWDSGVWKSRLYVKTGLIPAAGTRYRITAELTGDRDMPFELLFNNGDEEKGYGALYGQSLKAGETSLVEAVVTGNGDGDELVLQFSLGEAPEESTLRLGNLHVEKVIDHYTNALPAAFALDRSVATGKTLYGAIPVSYKALPLTNFSYSGRDTVYEGHDDGYVVSLEEAASSATLKITQAPASDRGVWKVKLFAATGVTLQAGATYRIAFDVESARDQAEYEVCFDGNAENAYGALYGRSLTAGGTDHIEALLTPEESHGVLTLRLQLGKTDTTAGNTVTIKGLVVEKLTPQVVQTESVALSAGNVWEEHIDGFAQTVSASGSAATLNITAVPAGADEWNSKLMIDTGLVPTAGARYRVSAKIGAAAALNNFHIRWNNDGESDPYVGEWNLSAPGVYTYDFTAPASAEHCKKLILALELGKSVANNTITVSELQVCEILSETLTDEELTGFAYPVVTAGATANNSFDLEANSGAAATLTGDGASATATVTTHGDDWHVKLYAKPGLALEAGQSYTISMDVDGASGCTACYKNTATGAEDGFGTETIGTGTVVHTVTPSESGTLEILLKIGNVADNTAVTVRNVQIKKNTTDYIPLTLSGFAYPSVTPASTANNSFALEANSGAEAALTGSGSSATATVTRHGDDWHVKLYAKPNLELEAGKTYRISMNVTGASGCTACYKNTATGAEDGFGIEPIGSGAVVHTVTPTESGTLEILLKIGNVADNTAVTVSGVKIEEAAESATDVTPGTVNYWLEPPGEGAAATQSGNSVTIVTPTPADDWKIKFYAQPGMALEAGKKYRVSFDVTNANGCQVCYKDLTVGETGYGDLWLSSDSQSVSQVVTGSGGVLEILLKLGKLPADTVVTVSNVHIYELTSTFGDVSLSGFAYPLTTPESTVNNSFDLEANSGAAAKLGGDGASSATATVTTPGADWNVKLYAKPNVTLEAGQSYRISMNVTGASGCTACYKNVDEGNEEGFGTESIGSGTVSHVVTPTADGKLEILLKIGNLPADTTVTVSNVKIEKHTTGELDVTPEGFAYPVTGPSSTEKKSFDLEAGNGAAATLGGNGTSCATATVTTSGDDWHIKLYAKPGVELQAGQTYTAEMNVTGADGCAVCYKRVGGEETDYGTETAVSGAVSHTFTPDTTGTLEILLKLGTLPAGTTVTVSDVRIKKLNVTLGENQMPALSVSNIGHWAHDGYAASLSVGGSSAGLTVGTAPDTGKEPWKVKLFLNAGVSLTAGKSYRVSADVASTAALDYAICYNDAPNGGGEANLGTKSGLHAGSAAQTVSCEINPAADAALYLQLNLGNAASGTTVTVSNVKIEEIDLGAGESVVPSFSYNSVGNFNTAADAGYITALEQGASSATFRILQAPADRNPWNVKLNVRTGFTPEDGKGYRVSFDIVSAGSQELFEVFYDGETESAYGALYAQSLSAEKQTVSYILYPGESKGELSVQIRLGKTDGTEGNIYTVSNLKIDEVTFRYTQTPETKEVTTLVTQKGYVEHLETAHDRATLRIEKTPAEGREPWKSKLFVETGVTLKAGQKYRISMDVKSVIPTPFEVCFNNGDEEKGLGAMYGLISTPSGQYVEYVVYPREDIHLVLQLSLGNCAPPNSIVLSNVKVEKAGVINPVSDTIFSF